MRGRIRVFGAIAAAFAFAEDICEFKFGEAESDSVVSLKPTKNAKKKDPRRRPPQQNTTNHNNRGDDRNTTSSSKDNLDNFLRYVKETRQRKDA